MKRIILILTCALLCVAVSYGQSDKKESRKNLTVKTWKTPVKGTKYLDHVTKYDAKGRKIEETEYTGTASGGLVTVVMTGKHQVVSVSIKPEAVDPDDIEMLEDLVAAAVNDACRIAGEAAEAEMGKLTGGMNIPGL